MTEQEKMMQLFEQYRSGGGDMDSLSLFMDYVTSMAANGRTPLGLNQWKSSDKPVMEDFNEDNRMIDAELRALRAELANKATNEDNRMIDAELRALREELSNKVSMGPIINYIQPVTMYVPPTTNFTYDYNNGWYQIQGKWIIYCFDLEINNWQTAARTGNGALRFKMPAASGFVIPMPIRVQAIDKNGVTALFPTSISTFAISPDGYLSYQRTDGYTQFLRFDDFNAETEKVGIHGQIMYMLP